MFLCVHSFPIPLFSSCGWPYKEVRFSCATRFPLLITRNADAADSSQFVSRLIKNRKLPTDRHTNFFLSLSLSLFYFHAKRNERHMKFLTKNHKKYQLLLVGLNILFCCFKIYWPASQCWKSSFETRARLDQLLH